jgi:hypothetical protein
MKTNGSQRPASGSNGAPSNLALLAAAAKDADSTMSFDATDSPVLTCPYTASPRPDTNVATEKKHWIAIEFADEQGFPMAEEDFRIVLPDGTVVEDNLDDKGCAKITGIDSGSCRVSFPDRDAKDWKHS